MTWDLQDHKLANGIPSYYKNVYSNYGYSPSQLGGIHPSELQGTCVTPQIGQRHNWSMQMQQHHFAPPTPHCPTRLELCRQKSGLRVVYWKAEPSTFQAHTMWKCTNLLNDIDLSLFLLSTCDHINGRFLFGLKVNYCVPKFHHLLHNKWLSTGIFYAREKRGINFLIFPWLALVLPRWLCSCSVFAIEFSICANKERKKEKRKTTTTTTTTKEEGSQILWDGKYERLEQTTRRKASPIFMGL